MTAVQLKDDIDTDYMGAARAAFEEHSPTEERSEAAEKEASDDISAKVVKLLER